MSDGIVQVPADSTGKKVDTSELTVGANTVERQRVVLSDDATAAGLASVKNANPAGTEYALVTRPIPSGTQAVSVASLPLPTGAALDATLTGGTQKAIARGGAKGTTAAADLTSNPIDANTQALHVDGSKVTQPVSGTVTVQQSTAANLKVDLSGTAANATAIKTDGSAVTQPISAASLPLPTGAALDATLTGGTQQSKVTDGTNVATVKAASTAAVAADKALVVAVSPNNTVPVSAASLPLPSGAALDATLTGGTQQTKITDGTNIATVKAASTAPAAADKAVVVVLSPNAPGSHYAAGPHSNPVTLASTGLNSLANNGQVLSAAVENGTSLDLYADFEMLVTFGVAPTAGKTIDLYVVRSVDGTNYEDADSTSILPASGFVGSFSVRAVTTAQRMILPQVVVPPKDFKVVLKNNATGQAFAASGNTLRANFYRWSGY